MSKTWPLMTVVTVCCCTLIIYFLLFEKAVTNLGIEMWPKSTSESSLCGTLEFSKTPLPLTALASFPGSGNTWVRFLLQEATGLLTGSEYHDTELKHLAFPGEGVNNVSALVVKTHACDANTMSRYHKAVVLVRHPKDAILSEFHRVYGGGHFSRAQLTHFQSRWLEFATEHTQAWQEFYQCWMTFPRDVLFIRYDHLVTDLSTQLRKILDFLQISIDENRLACALTRDRETYKRHKLLKDEMGSPFDEESHLYLGIIYNRALTELQNKAKKVFMQ